jgi:hypothetical protein
MPTTGDFERQRRRVDVMVGAVIQFDVEVDDREADERAAFGGFAHALFNAGIYSLGMLPPLTASVKVMPEPRSPGVTLNLTRPN